MQQQSIGIFYSFSFVYHMISDAVTVIVDIFYNWDIQAEKILLQICFSRNLIFSLLFIMNYQSKKTQLKTNWKNK